MVTALTVVAVVFSVAEVARARDTSEAFGKGIDALSGKRYRQALDHFREAESGLGKFGERIGSPGESPEFLAALTTLEKDVAANPKNAQLQCYLGSVYRFAGKMTWVTISSKRGSTVVKSQDEQNEFLQKAAQSLSKALELNPEYDEAAYNLAETYSMLGKTSEAVTVLGPAAARRPNDVAFRYFLAKLYVVDGQLEQAARVYETLPNVPSHGRPIVELERRQLEVLKSLSERGSTQPSSIAEEPFQGTWGLRYLEVVRVESGNKTREELAAKKQQLESASQSLEQRPLSFEQTGRILRAWDDNGEYSGFAHNQAFVIGMTFEEHHEDCRIVQTWLLSGRLSGATLSGTDLTEGRADDPAKCPAAVGTVEMSFRGEKVTE